ncbi:substrate-binding domain-containing protein [Aetokthonos hydrillicola Thurmond2011]|jgi:phosphate transport system substrate-binding protein|uniref:Substrate-binding domain-containing protein n=1 Tax=Aetokthonos hydrillicola Thurmond2011 TaxID=2712845 RepID=A0AAP5M838_9CYAN|nr:substrate-binding domain-containing protein [Aetokthonos hydrillicola]MBW4589201.1 substrate-binding domain-containing protein [Aetokthonos hydrillicola CCALA 1050]MDR9898761.1 substrate-binding domain-containing protein [Aetokthonos hydrillicola Thurmond2011]
MNSRESNTKGTVICGFCCYEANPLGASHCEKCGETLIINSITENNSESQRSTPYRGWLIMSLALVLVFGTGYFFWQQIKVLTTVSTSTNTTSIRLYNSIKEVPNVPKGTFNYGGAVLFASITAAGAHQAMTNAHPGFHLVYTEPTYGKPGNSRSLEMLLNNELSFAQIALPLTDIEYNKAKQRGFTLEQVPVAIDAIVAFSHPDISIPGISVDQLQDIYKGKITNWSQLGGPDLPIIAFARPKVATLLHVLLGPEVDQVSPRVKYIRDYTEAIRKVASTPGAISFGGSGPLVGQKTIRTLALAKANSQDYVQPFINNGSQINATAFKDGDYPMIRRLFIAIRRDGKIDEQAGVAYTNMLLSREGQQFVEKAGFLPLR